MVDFDALAAFLNDDEVGEGRMDLSELDGFMAGIIAGPAPVSARAWLPIVWGDGDPGFRDVAEETLILETIGARYDAVLAGLDASNASYEPIFWEDFAGATITEDWAAGFMQAVAMNPTAWTGILRDDGTASLLIPIAAIAGLALPADAGGDLDLPEEILDRMIDDAETVLPRCVIELRRFWRARGVVPESFRSAPTH